MAPPFAVRMAADLAVLPAFIAERGSLIITDSDDDARWLEQLNDTFNFDVHAIKRSELRDLGKCQIRPWGWCLDLRRRLVKWGASRESLLTKDEIYHLRGLSHRRISVLIHLRLQELLGKELCPAPVELATTDEVLDFVRQHRNCYIKTPWSSSGRGIYHATNGVSPELEPWCRGALKRQGSVLCEVALDKVMDFAVEFYAEHGKAQARGFSVFVTDSHSQYSHGIVAEKGVLKDRITELYPNLDEVVDAMTQVVDEIIAPHYSGWFGIDMLLYNKGVNRIGAHLGETDAASIGIDPCVELNLRPTMGAVTAMLGERVLAPGRTATFHIEQRTNTSEPWSQECNATIENGRLQSGTLCLTPPSDFALYRALLTVD